MAEIGWAFAPSYAGRGFATEAATALVTMAFDHYPLHRLFAHLDPRNERSVALCERLGMTREAHLRRDWPESRRHLDRRPDLRPAPRGVAAAPERAAQARVTWIVIPSPRLMIAPGASWTAMPGLRSSGPRPGWTSTVPLVEPMSVTTALP